MVEDKSKSLLSKINKINSRWQKENKQVEGKKRIRLGTEVEGMELVSTGNPALDWGLGGGIPKGTVFEIAGQAGVGKCLSPHIKVVMYDCSTKEAREIIVGDKLMGPDGLPREVLSVTTGIDKMYRIIPEVGTCFIVNEPHILSFKNKEDEVVNISVREYLELENKEDLVLWRPILPFSKVDIGASPYDVGAHFHLINQDEALRILNIITFNSIDMRREFLAGFLDSYSTSWGGSLVIKANGRELIEKFTFLVNSLGLMITLADRVGNLPWEKTLKIYGDLSSIPLKKKYPVDSGDMTRVPVSMVEELEEGQYYGFTLDGDGLFLLQDHFVTHNTTTMAYIMAEVQKTSSPYVIYYHTEESRKPEKAWELAKVDPDKVLYIDARKYGEDGINLVREILVEENGLPNNLIGLVAIDSWAALAPASEIESVDKNGMEGATMARLAALSSKLFRIMCGQGWLSEGCMVGIVNQLRANIASVPMPEVSTGGSSIKYYPKIRVMLRQGSRDFLRKPVEGGEVTVGPQDSTGKFDIIGHRINYYVVKNNTGSAPPFRRGSWDVIYDVGIDCVSPIITEALEYGIIQCPSRITYVIRTLDENGNIISGEKIKGRSALTSIISSSQDIQKDLQRLNSKVRAYLQTVDYVNEDGHYIINNTVPDLLELASKVEDSGELKESL